MNTRELAEELRDISYHVASARGKEIIVLAAEKIEQLQSKIEQLEKDAERYKKIIDKCLN